MYKTGYTGSIGAWIEAVMMLQLLGSQIPVSVHRKYTPGLEFLKPRLETGQSKARPST